MSQFSGSKESVGTIGRVSVLMRRSSQCSGRWDESVFWAMW